MFSGSIEMDQCHVMDQAIFSAITDLLPKTAFCYVSTVPDSRTGQDLTLMI